MQTGDLPALERRLAELADAFGGRPATKGALKVWMDALLECSFDDVQRALSDWPKKATKMPSPADILKACREQTSGRIEEQSRRNNSAPGFDVGRLSTPDSPVAQGCLAQIKAILAKGRPEPKDWARKLKAREESGELLNAQQRRLWREALRVTE